MKASEFLDLVKSSEFSIYWDDTAHDLCGSGAELYENNLTKELKEKGYVLKSEDGYGGEGEGENYWGVFSVTHNNEVTYFRLSGWYASYDGPEVDIYDLEEVHKVPVETYEWRAK